eukprot:1665217-Pleurochrysis_carterae.AAC.1
MRGSPFIKPFEPRVSQWEKQLVNMQARALCGQRGGRQEDSMRRFERNVFTMHLPLGLRTAS